MVPLLLLVGLDELLLRFRICFGAFSCAFLSEDALHYRSLFGVAWPFLLLDFKLPNRHVAQPLLQCSSHLRCHREAGEFMLIMRF